MEFDNIENISVLIHELCMTAVLAYQNTRFCSISKPQKLRLIFVNGPTNKKNVWQCYVVSGFVYKSYKYIFSESFILLL